MDYRRDLWMFVEGGVTGTIHRHIRHITYLDFRIIRLYTVENFLRLDGKRTVATTVQSSSTRSIKMWRPKNPEAPVSKTVDMVF